MRFSLNCLPLSVLWLAIATCSLGNVSGPVGAAERLAPAFKAVTKNEGVLLLEGDRPVLFYQRAPKALNGRYERAGYVHPLYSLDGQVLTEDFPADHLHHRGIFWAWHQLWMGEKPLGDGWAIRDFSWEVRDLQIDNSSPESIAILATVNWKSPLRQGDQGPPGPVVQEKTTIKVHAASADNRKIDFRIELAALQPGVRLGGSEDDKGYGGFSVRVQLPEDVRFSGRDGEIEPQIGAVAAGPWMDITGTFAQGAAGVTILEHPSLPGFPQPWILRRSRSMQNPAWPGRHPVALPVDQPLVLRYRLVVHRGGVTREAVEQWQKEWRVESGKWKVESGK